MANIGMIRGFNFLIKAKKFQPLDSDFFSAAQHDVTCIVGALNILSIFKMSNVIVQIILQHFYKMLI